MRKKLFNILLKLKIIVIFLLMSNINTALSNCETFSNDLAQLNYKYKGSVDFENFGFDLMEKYDENTKSWKFTKENGNFQVGRIYDPKHLKFFKAGDQILKANQKNFSPEILNENDTIEFEILNKEEIIKKKITKSKYTTFNPILDIKYLDFNKIDTKNGIVEFSMKYDIFSRHLSESHPELWNVVEENIILKLDDGSYTYYVCDYTQKQFNDLKLYPPEKGFKILNEVKSDKDLVDNKTYELSPYSTKLGNSDEYLFISSELGGTYSIKNKFNLKTFPFDKQTVRIKIIDDFQRIPNTVLFESSLSYLSLSNIKDNNDIPGWNIKSFDFNILNYQNPFFMEDDYATGIELSMVIERKHSYYLYKVILPIVLILSVCWLVVWIDPKELEARLTVTIVCLLSLIAYNFVIDSELPKLEYLTVLDWIILTSYIYAVIPNILSVVSFRLLKTNQLLGNNIEKLSTRYGVLSYFLVILLIILINANINPNNSTAIISWMALK